MYRKGVKKCPQGQKHKRCVLNFRGENRLLPPPKKKRKPCLNKNRLCSKTCGIYKAVKNISEKMSSHYNSLDLLMLDPTLKINLAREQQIPPGRKFIRVNVWLKKIGWLLVQDPIPKWIDEVELKQTAMFYFDKLLPPSTSTFTALGPAGFAAGKNRRCGKSRVGTP